VIKVNESDISPTLFIKNSDITTVDATDVKTSEVETYIVDKSILDGKARMLYFNGTDDATQPATFSFWSDAKGKVLFVEKPAKSAVGATTFAKKSDVNAAVPEEPTEAEIKTFLTDNNLLDDKLSFFISYNQTDDETNEMTDVFYVDNVGKVTRVNTKADDVGLLRAPIADVNTLSL
jgi:hypothetical protein